MFQQMQLRAINPCTLCGIHFLIDASDAKSKVDTVLVMIKLTKNPVPLRLHCGSGNWLFVIISSCFAIFKNAVHSLEPGETPSNSASHQAPNYVQRPQISQNTLKRCVAVAVRLRLFFQFTLNQYCIYISHSGHRQIWLHTT